jgi:exodeoxyribonuclease VII small subunit
MAKPTGKNEPTFESALERLEHIVEEMEGDRLPLEELLGRYEEGTNLVKVCQQRLSAAEKRIELIHKILNYLREFNFGFHLEWEKHVGNYNSEYFLNWFYDFVMYGE